MVRHSVIPLSRHPAIRLSRHPVILDSDRGSSGFGFGFVLVKSACLEILASLRCFSSLSRHPVILDSDRGSSGFGFGFVLVKSACFKALVFLSLARADIRVSMHITLGKYFVYLRHAVALCDALFSVLLVVIEECV